VTDWRPALRQDVGRVFGQDGEILALHDPLFDRRVNLGPIARALAARLTGERPLAEVLEEVAQGQERSSVEHSFRTLLLSNLIDGAGAEIVARAEQVRAGTVPYLPVVLPGARFACQGSGDCCKSYTFGPLTDEDYERLRALPIVSAYPHLSDVPFIEERQVWPGGTKRYLKSIDQRCVFLLPDERCGIHAAFGAEHKPGFCRLYPYQDLPTIFGRRIYDRSECSQFGVSARQGLPISDPAEVQRVLALLPAQFELEHPLVLLDDRTPCDFGHLVKLQNRLCGLLAPAAAPERIADVLLLCARMLRRFISALSACPLAAGEPDRTVAAVVASEPAVLAEGQPDGTPERGRLALSAIALDILYEIRPAVALADAFPGHAFHYRKMKDLARAVEAVRLACEGGGAQPPALADPLLHEILCRSLRNQLFGRLALLENRPVPALLRIAFGLLVAVVFASELTAERGGGAVGMAELNAGHKLALRVLYQESLARVFLRHEEHTFDAIAAIAQMIGD
jgi:Fe-S-cluster containining protein